MFNIGNYLADRRISLGYTQKEIASMVGVTEATISRWESGTIANMRRDKINLLASALNTTPEFIMTGRTDEQNSAPGEEYTEGEKELIKLFRLVPPEQRDMILRMIRAAIDAAQ